MTLREQRATISEHLQTLKALREGGALCDIEYEAARTAVFRTAIERAREIFGDDVNLDPYEKQVFRLPG